MGAPSQEFRWYLNGPPLSFIPIPAPDPRRHHGWKECKDCKEQCSGHYYKIDDLWVEVLQGNNIQHEPPSQVILNEFNRCHQVPEESELIKVAEKVLLPYQETKIWFEHLKTVAENRKKGVAKAAATRKARKQKEKFAQKESERQTSKVKGNESPSARIPTSIEEGVCCTCNMNEPLDMQRDEVDWICCDSCISWHHMICVGILTSDEFTCEQWLCPNCVECWQR